MESRYDPRSAEEKWYSFWLKRNLFTPEPRDGEPFVIVMPPPNITGMLTIGHVLNMSIQDALIRWNMLSGRESLWLPGKDHAGIATQTAVERQLAEKGLTRHSIGREKFLERVWQWKDAMNSKITEQLQHLGCACDWTRERFTMDDQLSRAVRTAFVTLFKEGLIYRGEYVINSCPRCLTTLSDEEVEREDVAGKLYYMRYPIEGGGHVTVATTRPETMLGDVAVAVSPDDKRYKDSWGKTIVLPIIGRKMPFIKDEFVDPEFGTGAVKVTPAHDADDFLMGQRHGLKSVVVMDKTGVMNDNAGPMKGLDRFEARKRVLEQLEQEGLLEKVTDYALSLGKCYRCSTVVEPHLSKQYFVKMEPLAKPAIDVVRSGRVTFHPDRWTKVYYNWMEGIRDWCISRQLWWGHRIPVWHCKSCDEMVSEIDDPTECPSCGGALVQEEDVLDTWFSSWLWPISTLGWPGETADLKRYYPTSVLVTGPDIIFFWVARMIMAGLHFAGEIPFRDVYLHGLIRDEFGQKMSKSLGNSPDPSDLTAKYGADALRFTIISLTPKGSDVLFAERQVETGRNFANKVWNASRLINAATEEIRAGDIDAGKMELSDRWIISRTGEVTRQIAGYVDGFELNQAAKTVYDFVWHEFCDWYLEIAKERFYGDDAADRRQAGAVAKTVLSQQLKLLHPFMPFLTEEIWSVLDLGGGSILDERFGGTEDFARDTEAEGVMAALVEVVEAVRNIRGEMGVHPSASVPVFLDFSGDEGSREGVLAAESYIVKLGKVSQVSEGKPSEAEGPVATSIVRGIEVGVPLGDVIDVEVEKARLGKELARIDGLIKRTEARLDNPDFVSKAPPEVVTKEKDRIEQLLQTATKLKKNLSLLG
ncbi:MAG: valine--tRNA ligase [Candidatus Eisenbacteria bacterium]